MALDIKQLRQVKALYEAGTVTGAAEKLHISQPALTAHLNRLESVLGEKLFIRSAKGLEPTPLGQAVYDRARDMLLQWRDLESELSLLAGAEKGEIRVVCGAVIEQGIIPGASVAFLRSHPGVDLQVTVLNPERMLEWLREGMADVAVGAFPTVAGLNAQVLDTRDQRVAFYVRAGHPLLGLRKWKSQLRNFPLAGPEIPAETRRWMEVEGLLSTHRNLASDSYVLLKRVVLGTDHILGAPRFLFAEEVAAGALVELPLTDTPMWSVSVLVSRPASQSRVVQAFTACIRQEMEQLLG